MEENEQLLLEVLDILKGCSFRYWISQGTLLGLVREGRILPWDNDIDVSVWAHEVSQQEIIDIFKPYGFEIEYIPGDVGCIHFAGRSKHVDVGFYKVDSDSSTAAIKWVTPGGTALKKLLQFLVSVLNHDFQYRDIKGKGIGFKKIFYVILRPLVSIAPDYFQKVHDRLVERYGNFLFNYLGYSYPVSMLENIGTLDMFERSIPVPQDYEKFLQLTYGEDWRVPKQNYIWHEEANNLV